MDLADSMERLEKILVVAILFLAIADTAEIFLTTGMFWDFTVNVLNARDIVDPFFYHYMLTAHPAYLAITTPQFYAETYRDPLMPFILSLFTLPLHSYAPIVYQVFVVLFLLSALYYYSKTTKVNLLLLVLLFFNPFVLFTLFLLDGEEGIAFILMIFAIALLFKKRWETGMLLGLAGLAKYPSLIFFPLILLLPTWKKRAYALVAFALVTLPFLAANYLYYGSPFEAYLTEMGLYAGGAAPVPGVLLESLWVIFSFLIPAALVLVGLFAAEDDKSRRAARKMDHLQKILLVAIALGVVAWIYLARYPALDGTPRMGYLIFFGVALEMALLLQRFDADSIGFNAKRNLAMSFLIVISIGSLGYWFALAQQQNAVSSVGTNWIGFATAANALAQHGFANCDVISNAWVFIYYDNVTALNPSDNNPNAGTLPRLIYYGIGTDPSQVYIPPESNTIKYPYFNLVIPPDAACVH